MGSQGIKRRKRRPRPPSGAAGPGLGGNWELENSPFTFEGQIESLGRFGRGLRSASPTARLVATVIALLFAFAIVIGFLSPWLFD